MPEDLGDDVIEQFISDVELLLMAVAYDKRMEPVLLVAQQAVRGAKP